MEERETNAEPLFGNWHTDWSTQAASIKLPVVSTCVSDKHLLNLMCGITKTYNSGGAVQMFYAHSYIQNASLLDSKPKHNLGVCVWTQCRNSINHERLLSLCFHCSPSCVCSSFQACGSNTQQTQMFNWFTPAWQSVRSYLCLIRIGCVPLSFLVFLAWLLVTSPSLSVHFFLRRAASASFVQDLYL